MRQAGVAAATTKRIAAEAKVAEGSLYNHFAGKPDLLVGLVMERLPSIRDAFEALYRDDQPLAVRLTGGLRTMLAFYVEAQPIVAGITADPHLRDLCQTHFAHSGRGPHMAHEKLAEFLAREQGAGRLRSEAEPSALASMLIGACTEYAALSAFTGTAPGHKVPDDYVASVVRSLTPLFAEVSGPPDTRPQATENRSE